MASLLLVTNGLPGIVHSSIELGRRLQEAGHRVVYASSEGVRERVTHSGIPFRALPESGYPAFLEDDRRHGWIDRLRRIVTRRGEAVESLRASAFEELLRAESPDLVLLDGEMHEQIIVARAAGARLALLNTFVSIWRLPGMPPPHCLVTPGKGAWGGAAGLAMLWWAASLRKAAARWRQKLRWIGCDRVSVLRQLARRRGFDFGREVDFGQWLKPFTYRHLAVLSLHALEFEFPHRPPANVVYVGPQVPASRGEHADEAEEAERLRRVLEGAGSGAERKVVYVGFGSFFTVDRSLLCRVLAALGRHPEWQVVLSRGRTEGFDIEDIPPNVAVFSWVPQIEVLQAADVMIGHGGINSVDECVLCGVPMLVYPGPETDMAGTAARVTYQGIGIVGDAAGDGVGEIEARVGSLLEDRCFADEVARLQAIYASYRDNRVAERAIGALLPAASGDVPGR